MQKVLTKARHLDIYLECQNCYQLSALLDLKKRDTRSCKNQKNPRQFWKWNNYPLWFKAFPNIKDPSKISYFSNKV